jgi:reversibly glycosylated polypeptide/UDP-arabinopyranose mutase
MKDTVLVVPSIRKESWDRFLKEWSRVGLFEQVDVILVEDNPEKTFYFGMSSDDGVGNNYHYSWEDIENELGENSWIIPRRSDTVRSFGYYMAWKGRRDAIARGEIDAWKYVLTLDDDCYPPTEDGDGFFYKDQAAGFLAMHRRAIEGRSRWFNTLTSVKPRGVPFFETGKFDRIVINHGLWTNVLDYDAPTQLANPERENHSFDNRIVPVGLYFPMCGMNIMWKNDVTVLMYHLMMGKRVSLQADARQLVNGVWQPILTALPFDRFGDIWCGIIAKKICDIFDLSISTGTPYVHHDRASNPFANLKKEANGLEVNESFWKYIDKFVLLDENVPLSVIYEEMGRHVAEYDEFPQYREYFKTLGEAMIRWAKLFR